MSNLRELKNKMRKFEKMHVIFWHGRGHLIWRHDTGNTVQLCDIEVYEKRQGIGSRLIKKLVKDLSSDPPDSIFGFTAVKNKNAQKFYKALGFELILADNLYKKGAYLFVIIYSEAKKI